MTDGLGVVVLAAGAGSRMGDIPKSLVEVDGVPVLYRLLQSVSALRPAATVLVLGHHAEAISRVMQGWQQDILPTVVRNPLPGQSPASSLRLGLHALLERCSAARSVMVLLADQPLLTAEDLQDARQAFVARSGDSRIVWPVHCGTPGHPVVLDVSLARAWLSQPTTGLRAWAQQRPGEVATWQPGHARCTTDLDTPADLAQMAAETGNAWTLPVPHKRE